MLLRFVLYWFSLKDITLSIFADVLFVVGIKFGQGTWLCVVVNISSAQH